MNAFGPNASLYTPPLSRNLHILPILVNISFQASFIGRLGRNEYIHVAVGQALIEADLPLVQGLKERLISCQVGQLSLGDRDALSPDIWLEVSLACLCQHAAEAILGVALSLYCCIHQGQHTGREEEPHSNQTVRKGTGHDISSLISSSPVVPLEAVCVAMK